MSFFGFNTNLPRDQGHPVNAPGFSQHKDPFASLGRPDKDEDGDVDALDFEETYDGLGDQLDETDDTFNDETFGAEPSGGVGPAQPKPIGKDFDFFGQTAQVSDAINEEQLRFSRQQPTTRASILAEPPKIPPKPARTGYEKYKEPGYIPDLQANASLWGVPAKKPAADIASASHQRQESYDVPAGAGAAAPARKMMSLEEVEAAMRAQSKKRVSQQELPPASQAPQIPEATKPVQVAPQQQQQQQQQQASYQPQILQRQQQAQAPVPAGPPFAQQHPGPQGGHRPHPAQQGPSYPSSQQPQQIMSRQQQQHPQTNPSQQAQHAVQHQAQAQPPSQQPRQILQNPNRLSASHSRQPGSGPHEMPLNEAPHPSASPSPGGPPGQAPLVTHPHQLLQLSEEERAAFLIEDAKRAKRNHKIYLLSKDNGLMTPQDKNFITRIQLQQLVTATGNPNDGDGETAMAEDFYYQVHSQIRGGPRQNPHQPLNHFAQTYLFQTGGRPNGAAGRRFNRAGDNHMQRMEQQVQRAVAAAKAKPKNKQLVLEGSLGRIAFSNAKTPKPLLNIKRAESGGDPANRPGAGGRAASERKALGATVSSSDRKSILRQIENVYSILMQMENHERHLRPPPTEQTDPAMMQQHLEWREKMQGLNDDLWRNLKVEDPIIPNSPIPHPFIAFLTFAKGKKATPRIFRHIDSQARLTILTMIVVHLGVLDVVRLAQLRPGETVLPASTREDVELFCQAVLPSLFGYVNEAPLTFVLGLLGILLDRVDLRLVATTKVGLSILTMFLSRAELVKQAGGVDDAEWEQWTTLYTTLFNALEPQLASIFPLAPRSITSGDDMYVWQFLAALGLGASPDQQQRLVLGVNQRVMETVVQARTLPVEMCQQRLGDVNLFMRAIGLDVELLG